MAGALSKDVSLVVAGRIFKLPQDLPRLAQAIGSTANLWVRKLISLDTNA